MQSVRLRVTPVLPDHDASLDVDGFVRHNYNNNNTSSPIESKETLSMKHDKEVTMAIFLLNVVAIIWGTQHAVIKMVVNDSSAASFTFLRFALAALIAIPYASELFVWKDQSLTTNTNNNKDNTIQTAWRWGAEMGCWMFLGFAFQAIGLETTTAQRSGFLLYLNVKFVPLFSWLFLGRPVSLPTWMSALAAFGGTALLATDGQSIGFNSGDVWSIAAAAASAMYILRLEKAAAKVKDAAQLNAACLFVVAVLAAMWTVVVEFQHDSSWSANVEELVSIAQSHPLQLMYLGAVTTTLANFIQSKGQQLVSPERASIIYSLDPVYGAFFSWFLLGETIGGIQSIVGASLITVAAATNAFLDFGKPKEETFQTK